MMTLEFDATNRFVLSAKLAWPFFSKRLNNKVPSLLICGR